MTKTIKKSLLAVLSIVFTLVCFVGIINLMPVSADSTVISTAATAEANVTTEENSGLRFTANLDGAKMNALVAEYGKDNVKAGMMVIPTDYLEKVTAADKEFTIAGVDASGYLAGYNYYTFANDFKEVDGEYQFYVTVKDIAEKNYNRNYTARAFIAIEASELKTVDGVDNAEFTQNGDYFYSYAPYDTEEIFQRNVYELAYKAYTEGSLEDSAAIAKKFIDSVVVINGANGTATIANNAASYTSPYTLDEMNGDYVVNSNVVMYNGERITSFPYEDKENDVKLHKLVTDGNAVKNNDGSYTTNGLYINGTHMQDFSNQINEYFALDGKYGIGTEITVNFTGNNIPQILLFADEINSDITFNGGDGILVTPGVITSEGRDGFPSRDWWVVSGPNRLNTHYHWSDTALASNKNVSDDQGFSQAYLNANSSIAFDYTVGTRIDAATERLMVYAALKESVSGKQIAYKETYLYLQADLEQTSSGGGVLSEKRYLTAADVNDGAIVIYASFNGENGTTTCKVTDVKENDGTTLFGGTKAEDGTYTLTTDTPSVGWASSTAYDVREGFLSLNGKYGVGTFIELNFKGANVPYVMFFSDIVNDSITSVGIGGKGIVSIPGWVNPSSSTLDAFRFEIHGPNKFSGSYTDSSKRLYGEASINYLGMSAYSTYSQDTEYRYVIGTTTVDGILNMVIQVYDESTDKLLLDKRMPLGTLTASSVTAGNIIVYANFNNPNGKTSFKISKMPYKADPNVILNNTGAITVNNFLGDDTLTTRKGSVTFKATPDQGEVLDYRNASSIVLGEQFTNQFVKIGFNAVGDGETWGNSVALGIGVRGTNLVETDSIQPWGIVSYANTNGIYVGHSGATVCTTNVASINPAGTGFSATVKGDKYYVIVGVTGTDDAKETADTSDDVTLHFIWLNKDGGVRRYLAWDWSVILDKKPGSTINESGYISIYNWASVERTITYEVIEQSAALDLVKALI